MQYNFIEQDAYRETGSVAALNVKPTQYSNMVTLGAGAKLYFNNDHWRFIGWREFRAMVSYDVLRPVQITTANFVAGSDNFTIANKPPRLCVKLGTDFSFEILKDTHLTFNYDYELRKKYRDHIGMLKLKYVFYSCLFKIENEHKKKDRKIISLFIVFFYCLK